MGFNVARLGQSLRSSFPSASAQYDKAAGFASKCWQGCTFSALKNSKWTYVVLVGGALSCAMAALYANRRAVIAAVGQTRLAGFFGIAPSTTPTVGSGPLPAASAEKAEETVLKAKLKRVEETVQLQQNELLVSDTTIREQREEIAALRKKLETLSTTSKDAFTRTTQDTIIEKLQEEVRLKEEARQVLSGKVVVLEGNLAKQNAQIAELTAQQEGQSALAASVSQLEEKLPHIEGLVADAHSKTSLLGKELFNPLLTAAQARGDKDSKLIEIVLPLVKVIRKHPIRTDQKKITTEDLLVALKHFTKNLEAFDQGSSANGAAS